MLLFVQKLPWLKLDFDRIKHESDSEPDNGDQAANLSAQDLLRTKVQSNRKLNYGMTFQGQRKEQPRTNYNPHYFSVS